MAEKAKMSALTRAFLLYLISIKSKDQGLIHKNAAIVMDRYLKDAPDGGDAVDAAIRMIIDMTDADGAYEYLAELIT